MPIISRFACQLAAGRLLKIPLVFDVHIALNRIAILADGIVKYVGESGDFNIYYWLPNSMQIILWLLPIQF